MSNSFILPESDEIDLLKAIEEGIIKFNSTLEKQPLIYNVHDNNVTDKDCLWILEKFHPKIWKIFLTNNTYSSTFKELLSDIGYEVTIFNHD